MVTEVVLETPVWRLRLSGIPPVVRVAACLFFSALLHSGEED